MLFSTNFISEQNIPLHVRTVFFIIILNFKKKTLFFSLKKKLREKKQLSSALFTRQYFLIKHICIFAVAASRKLTCDHKTVSRGARTSYVDLERK